MRNATLLAALPLLFGACATAPGRGVVASPVESVSRPSVVGLRLSSLGCSTRTEVRFLERLSGVGIDLSDATPDAIVLPVPSAGTCLIAPARQETSPLLVRSYVKPVARLTTWGQTLVEP